MLILMAHLTPTLEKHFLYELDHKARPCGDVDNERSQIPSVRGPVSYEYPGGLVIEGAEASEKSDVAHATGEVAMPCKCFTLKSILRKPDSVTKDLRVDFTARRRTRKIQEDESDPIRRPAHL
jgi:hypothetical protein